MGILIGITLLTGSGIALGEPRLNISPRDSNRQSSGRHDTRSCSGRVVPAGGSWNTTRSYSESVLSRPLQQFPPGRPTFPLITSSEPDRRNSSGLEQTTAFCPPRRAWPPRELQGANQPAESSPWDKPAPSIHGTTILGPALFSEIPGQSQSPVPAS